MTKGNMAVVSFIFLGVWGFVLALYLHEHEYSFSVWLFSLWYVGTLISCIRKIPIGYVADVEILGIHSATWREGYSLIVPVVPFFLFINRYLIALWTRPARTDVGDRTRVTNEESFHHRDDRYAEKRVVMRTGALGMLSFSVFQNFFRVLFNVNHPSHFTALSLLFIVPFYVLLGIATLLGPVNEITRFEREKGGDGIGIMASLVEMPKPIFPYLQRWRKEGGRNTLVYFDENGVRYFYHPKSDDGFPVHLPGRSDTCFMVLAGEEVVFETKIPPRFVANMHQKVSYVPKDQYLSWFWQLWSLPDDWKRKNLPSLLIREEVSWRNLHDNWDKVDTRYNLFAKALKKNRISQKAGGGLVCF